MDIIIKRCCIALCSFVTFLLLSQNLVAGPENEYRYTGTVDIANTMAAANPCAANPCAANPCAANPCAANPCAGKNPCAANPCAANPCAGKNPCAANPCAANPCAGKNPCAANPCAANPCAGKNPCGANPCAANPCAGNPCSAAAGVNPKLITRPPSAAVWYGDMAELRVLGEKLWSDTSISSNGLSCDTCHQNNGAFMASFKQPYPHRVAMASSRAGLKTIAMDEMVQLCLVVPMATYPMLWGSKELAALTAFTAIIQKSFRLSAMNPCAARNPCAGNPCSANPCAVKNPCGANPCAANPCGAKNPCGANPCAAKQRYKK